MIPKRKALPTPFQRGAPADDAVLWDWLRAVEAQERDKYARSDIWKERVEELIEVSRRLEDRWRPIPKLEFSPKPQAVHVPGKWWSLSKEAAETLRKVLCENLVERIVVGRHVWRRLRDEVFACARAGFVPLPPECTTFENYDALYLSALSLVQTVGARQPEAVIPCLLDFFSKWEFRAKTQNTLAILPFETVLYAAGCQMRAIGQVHLCFKAFSETVRTWWLVGNFPMLWEPQDAVVPGRLFPSRYGIPDLRWPLNSGEPNVNPHWVADFPGHPVHIAMSWDEGQRFNWSDWDHVIGCGTTINNAVLDVLGVPSGKRHIWEVHGRFTQSYLDPAAKPLKGRVAVVDDLFEGRTSALLAQVYNADIICLAITGYIRPESTIRPVAAYPGGWDAILEIFDLD